MFLPVVVYYAIFSYAPMYGILMAFKDYKVRRGIWGSPWVGLNVFRKVFNMPIFWTAFKNNVNDARTGWTMWLKNAGIKG